MGSFGLGLVWAWSGPGLGLVWGLVALVGLALVLTGLPVFAVLIMAAVIGASGAVLIGGVPAAVLGS